MSQLRAGQDLKKPHEKQVHETPTLLTIVLYKPMPDYETLDTIADAYTPALALFSLIAIAISAIQGRWRTAALRLMTIFIFAIIAYGFMFIDSRLELWPRFALDYSTHTAVSLVLVIFLSVINKKLAAFWLISFLAYVLLMLYQQYHTIADIVTTAVAVIIPTWLVTAYFYRHWPWKIL